MVIKLQMGFTTASPIALVPLERRRLHDASCQICFFCHRLAVLTDHPFQMESLVSSEQLVRMRTVVQIIPFSGR